MSVRIIETATEDVLYRRYHSESSPQGCYIELDLREGTLSADYDSEVGGAVPSAVYHGFDRRYNIPALTGSATDDLMHRIVPLADRILADWEEIWNGNNHVARLGEDAQAAEEELIAEIGYGEDGYTDPEDLVTVWDVDGAVNGSEVEDFGITADTTDERLDEIEEDIRKSLAEVSDSGVVVLDGVAEHLRDKRLELAVTAFDDATAAAERERAAAEAAGVLARGRAAARVVELSSNQRAAAQHLGLDQSTVNKLIKRAEAAGRAGAE